MNNILPLAELIAHPANTNGVLKTCRWNNRIFWKCLLEKYLPVQGAFSLF